MLSCWGMASAWRGWGSSKRKLVDCGVEWSCQGSWQGKGAVVSRRFTVVGTLDARACHVTKPRDSAVGRRYRECIWFKVLLGEGAATATLSAGTSVSLPQRHRSGRDRRSVHRAVEVWFVATGLPSLCRAERCSMINLTTFMVVSAVRCLAGTRHKRCGA